jgi:thioredoxin-related protein
MKPEQENIFRMLREDELLVSRFWCRVGIHTWTKYREPETAKIRYDMVLIQQRRCAYCNKYDRMIIRDKK